MPSREFEVYVGAVVFNVQTGEFKPFFSMGLHYSGMKDAQRQIMQDYLQSQQGEIAEAMEPFTRDLNALGGALLADDPTYQGAKQVLDKMLARKGDND